MPIKLSISYGNSRQAINWSQQQTEFPELAERLKTTLRTSETAEQYHKMKKTEKDVCKDHGGFMGGKLKAGRRLRTNVTERSMLTEDVDHPDAEFLFRYSEGCRYETVLYSTHSHTPEAPRYRLVIPFTRPVNTDEYNAIARLYAAEYEIECFDPCSFIPNQMMYWPSTPSDGEYVYKHFDGDYLDPDAFLAKYPNWKDCEKLPRCASENTARGIGGKKIQDPLTKTDIVGAWCRAHSIYDVLDNILKDIYAPTDSQDRYHFIKSDSIPGVIVHDGKFVHSFHASDPAFDLELNAFDLVRVHLFPDDNDKKSFNAMADYASQDDATKLQVLKDKQAAASIEFAADDEDDDWKKQLTYMTRSTQLENTVNNLMLILTNDKNYRNFAYNELASRVQVTGPVPWDRPSDNKFWRDADTAQLKALLDVSYQCFSSRNHDVCFTKVADDRRFHPIRDYLDSLPEWDQVPRVDTLYIDYFGAEDNIYTREASRKPLVAAVARVYHPGTKFDCVPIVNGDQGIGKSTFYARLAGEYFSDSLSLIDMKDKSGAEKLQGFWILELGELAGMKKADIECVKGFISRTDDEYRPSYGRVVESHPRQCIIVGSTNSESGFLRDITGNRRFWPIKANNEAIKKRSWDLTKEEIDQIWAEALYYYNQGEDLRLSPEAEAIAFGEQLAAMESDERQGMVEEYLNTLLPENWQSMDLYQRREFLSNPSAPTAVKGTVARTTVSNAEIWCECFGKSMSDLKASDSYAIAALMLQVPGWARSKASKKLPIYGKQRLYEYVG